MRTGSGENIILIGMPTAGKSTVGVVLAKQLGYDYIDTDLLIQQQEGCREKCEYAFRAYDGGILRTPSSGECVRSGSR